MARTRRLLALAITGTAAVVLGGAAVSWACTGQGSIMLSPGAGPAGAVVTVRGTGFGANPVEIRWGSASSTAPLLGTAPSGNFAVDVKIPDARSGVYYVVAVPSAPAEGTTERAPGSASYTVTAPVPEPTPVTVSPEPQPTASESQSAVSQPLGSSQAGSQEGVQAAPQSAPVQAAAPSQAGASSSATNTNSARSSRSATTSPPGSKPVSAAASPVAPTAPAADPAVSMGTAEMQSPVMVDPLAVPDNAADSERRFGSAPVGLEGSSDTDRLGAGVALGAVLLAVGLVTLLGAGVVAVSRRRRASSRSVVQR